MRRLKVGVVGVGHLGKEHARIFAAMPDVELVGIVDIDAKRAAAVADRCRTRVFADHQSLAAEVDAASIVTPTLHHHAIACEFLSRGVPVLVEKPLAVNVEQAEELVALADRRGAILQVGHIERFNPAYETLRQLPVNAKFVECERHGAFTGRSTDIGAVLDLMIHDLDLLLDLVGGPVESVEAVGATIFGGHEDIVNARLKFKTGCVAHLTASRMSPNPKRKMRIWAPEGYAGIDFMKRALVLAQPSNELRTYGLEVTSTDPERLEALKHQVFTRYLEMREIDCSRGDNLTRELEHFVECVWTGRRPRVAGEDGRDAIALAAQVLEALHHHMWDNRAGGPTGPDELPKPWGSLLSARGERAAA